MTVADLLEALEGLDPGTEVRLMNQNSWPFEYSIAGTWAPQSSPTCPCAESTRRTSRTPSSCIGRRSPSGRRNRQPRSPEPASRHSAAARRSIGSLDKSVRGDHPLTIFTLIAIVVR